MQQDVTLQETMDSDPVTLQVTFCVSQALLNGFSVRVATFMMCVRLQEEYEIQKIWVEDKNRRHYSDTPQQSGFSRRVSLLQSPPSVLI